MKTIQLHKKVIMEELNLTLEEYIDFLKEYPYGQNHLKLAEMRGFLRWPM